MWNRLAEVGPLYPGVGWEVPLVLATVAIWISWTIWQIRHENAEHEEQVRVLREQGGGKLKENS